MKGAEVDTSGFQNIVLMLVGVLMIMLISNVLTIISNPDNIKIGSLVSGSVYADEKAGESQSVMPKFGNMEKNPVYIEVRADSLVIYPERYLISDADIRLEGNEFEKYLDRLAAQKDARYAVLLLSPDAALFSRRLRKIFADRDIDIGFEPWDPGRIVFITGMVGIDGTYYAAETQVPPPALRVGKRAIGDWETAVTEAAAAEAALAAARLAEANAGLEPGKLAKGAPVAQETPESPETDGAAEAADDTSVPEGGL